MTERTDAELLAILEMWGSGKSALQIGTALGCGKNTISGILDRTVNARGQASRHDGTLPARWWQAGLDKRGEA